MNKLILIVIAYMLHLVNIANAEQVMVYNNDLNQEANALFFAVNGKLALQSKFPDVPSSRLAMMDPPLKFDNLLKNSNALDAELYQLCVNKADDERQVLAIFNKKTKDAVYKINLDRLHKTTSAATDNQYAVYDVFTKQFIGIFSDSMEIKIRAHSCRLISVMGYNGSPLLIAIGDHIGQGCYEYISRVWNSKISTTTYVTKGLKGKNTSARMFVPDGWKLRFLAVNGKSSDWEEYRRQIFKFDIPDADGETVWMTTFDGGVFNPPYTRKVSSAPLISIKSVQK